MVLYFLLILNQYLDFVLSLSESVLFGKGRESLTLASSKFYFASIALAKDFHNNNIYNVIINLPLIMTAN